MEPIPVTPELAAEAARIGAELGSDGYTIDIPDQFIAAGARLLALPVLTLNARHFSCVRGLDVWDSRQWLSAGAGPGQVVAVEIGRQRVARQPDRRDRRQRGCHALHPGASLEALRFTSRPRRCGCASAACHPPSAAEPAPAS